MKKLLTINLVTFVFLFFSTSMLWATTYTKSSAGNYSSTSGWSPSYPGTTISSGDIVIINASVVTLNVNLNEIKGELRINSGAELNGSKELKAKDNGKLTVTGTLVAKNLKLEDDGNMVVSGTITLSNDFEAKDDATFTINSGASFTAKDIKIKDDAVGTNNGTMKATDDFKVEDKGTFTNSAGAVLTVVNDLELKDDASFTNVGTVNVEDDVKVENDATLNTTGVINICAPGNEPENKLEVKDNGALTGSGTFCLCSTNNNNTYTNSGTQSLSLTVNTNCNGPLPVELLNFKVERKESRNLLYWETASEISNAYFEIQISYDGIYFETIGKLNGAGNSNNLIKYSFENFQADVTQDIYYRIKNVDFDGKYDFSEILILKGEFNGDPEQNSVKVFPTVISNGSSLHVQSSNDLITQLQIISISGQVWEIELEENSNEITIPQDVPQGINFVIVLTNQSKSSHRIVVQ